MSFLNELKRRNVLRVGAAYIVSSWLLIQVAETIFPLFGYGDTPARLVVIVLAIAFIPCLIFSWAFEITPEGLKRDADVDREQSIAHVTGKKLDRIVLVVLALALAYFAFDRFVLVPAKVAEIVEETAQKVRSDVLVESYGDKSIAVLPFVNMSDDAGNEYFSDGISEELLNLLAKIPELRVISRSSAFSFKGKDVDIPTIAQRLKVAHVLEGSVRKAGSRVRITAQLIDARSDTHLWSDTYDRELEDIFAIQDEISGQIVQALKVALGTGEQEAMAHAQKPTENLAAYDHYLRGRYFWQRRGEDNIRRAIDLFEQATGLDPQFARAWSSLAAAHMTLPTYSDAPQDEYFPQALSAAQKALALDAFLAEAHAVLGDLARNERNWAEAEAHYRRAVASEPKSSIAHMWYGEHLMSVGRLRDALEETLAAYQLDPLNAGTNGVLGYVYFSLNDIYNTLKFGTATWDLGNPWGLRLQAVANLSMGKIDQAIILAEQFDEQWAEFSGGVSFLKLAMEAKTDAGKIPLYLKTLAEHEAEMFPWFPLSGYIAFGRADEAFRVANTVGDAAGVSLLTWWVLWRHDMAPFRQDPRFAELVTGLGLVDYWREHGWPDACQPAGDSVICE